MNIWVGVFHALLRPINREGGMTRMVVDIGCYQYANPPLVSPP